MKKTLLFTILFLINFCLFAYAEHGQVFRTVDSKFITFSELLEDLKKVDVIFVGEVHDREFHHEMQLNIIKALVAEKLPIVIGLEMFNYESQKELDLWSSGNINTEDFIRVYYKNWNFPWNIYDDIFIFIKDSKLPAIGLNVPPEITRKVATSGFASLTKEELKRLPPEIACIVNEEYMKFIRRAYAMHRQGGNNFQFFCEAQLLWDQSMAYNIAGYFKKHHDKKMVVLAGNGHAWKRGIPAQLKHFSDKINYRVILPYIEKYIDPNTIKSGDADYILIY